MSQLRPRCEHGVRLQGQLVVADVGGLQGEDAFQVVLGHRQRLLRQRVHQVEVEVVEAGILGQLHRRLGFAAVVDPAQSLEATVVEALDAEAQAIDAGLAIQLEAAVLGGAGVGLKGDLAPRDETQAAAGLLQETVDVLGREQARRATAEEHRVHVAAPGQRQVVVEVGQQRVDVRVERQRATALMRIEVAIRTLAHAPGQVDIQRQRWRGQRQDGSSVKREGQPASGAVNVPRWRSLAVSASPCASSAA
jgi:hypothetical protein